MLLADETGGRGVEGLLHALQKTADKNRRGTRLSDLRNPEQHLKLVGDPKTMLLDEYMSSALNSLPLAAIDAWSDLNTRSLHRVDTYRKLVVSGVVFQTQSSTLGDSFIAFESGGEVWNGTIQSILLPEGVSDINSTLLLVQVFEPLSLEDQRNDPYRMWGFASGELVYACFLEQPLAIQPSQILGHIATTDVGVVFGMQRPCVHTLPLDQV